MNTKMIMNDEQTKAREAARIEIVDSYENKCVAAQVLCDYGAVTFGVLNGYDAGYDAGFDAASNPWRPIRSVDDLPEEDGRYLWQRRSETGCLVQYLGGVFTTRPWFVKEYVAWMPIPDYTETPDVESGGGE